MTFSLTEATAIQRLQSDRRQVCLISQQDGDYNQTKVTVCVAWVELISKENIAGLRFAAWLSLRHVVLFYIIDVIVFSINKVTD